MTVLPSFAIHVEEKGSSGYLEENHGNDGLRYLR